MKSASQIIEALNKEKYFCECPCGCGEEIRLKDANLFYLNNFNAEGKKALMSLKDGLKQQRQEMKQRITSMQSKPKITAKAVKTLLHSRG